MALQAAQSNFVNQKSTLVFSYSHIIWFLRTINIYYVGLVLTILTESRAAMAVISAQETIPGQIASTLDLMASMTS